MDDSNHIDWEDIIFQGVETQQIDYKAALDWTLLTRSQRAKFAKHAMAMSNTQGGMIVIGVKEDAAGNPIIYEGLTKRQLRSFDPSTIGQTINRYADPAIDFELVKPLINGKQYAVIVVHPFSDLPHVCSDACGSELQQGVFYMRTHDARSRSVYRASELHALVQRALRNQRRVLGRMLRGILYEGRQFAEPAAEKEFERQLAASQAAARKHLSPKRTKSLIFLEIVAYPSNVHTDEQSLSRIRKTIETLSISSPVDPVGFNGSDQQVYFTNTSYLSRPGKITDEQAKSAFWQLFPSGLFHHVANLSTPTEPTEVNYARLVHRIGAGVAVLGQFYSALGAEDELLTFSFKLTNCEGAELIEAGFPEEGPFKCYIPEIIIRKRRTVADLLSGPVQHAGKIIKGICQRFNFITDRHIDLKPKLTPYFDRSPPTTEES